MEIARARDRTGCKFECGAFLNETHRFTKYMWQREAIWTNQYATLSTRWTNAWRITRNHMQQALKRIKRYSGQKTLSSSSDSSCS